MFAEHGFRWCGRMAGAQVTERKGAGLQSILCLSREYELYAKAVVSY